MENLTRAEKAKATRERNQKLAQEQRDKENKEYEEKSELRKKYLLSLQERKDTLDKEIKELTYDQTEKYVVDKGSITTKKDWRGETESIKKIELNFERSSSVAEVFNHSLVMATLYWSDPVRAEIIKMAEERAVELAKGIIYLVTYKDTNRGGEETESTWRVVASNEKRAIYVFNLKTENKYEIVSVKKEEVENK